VSAEDVREAQAAIANPPDERLAKQTRKIQRLGIAVAVITAILCVYFDAIAQKPPAMNHADRQAGFHLLVGSALWLAGTAIIGVVWWRNRKAKTRGPRDEPLTARLIDDGIALEWPAIRCELAWAYFDGYVETPRLFVFRDRAQGLYVVPIAVFDEAELSQFREAVHKNLPQLPMTVP
jgi:hypothetical protein